MIKSNTEIVFATDVVKEAKSLTVHNPDQASYASEVLSRANKALDILTTKEDERTKRLKEELEFIKAPYIEPKKALKAIIADLRTKLGAYQTASTQLAAGKAQVIAKKAEKELISMDVALRQLDAIETVASKITGVSGRVSFRPKQTLKIVSAREIPRSFMIPDEDAILEALVAGKKVAGCAIEIIQVPINRRA